MQRALQGHTSFECRRIARDRAGCDRRAVSDLDGFSSMVAGSVLASTAVAVAAAVTDTDTVVVIVTATVTGIAYGALQDRTERLQGRELVTQVPSTKYLRYYPGPVARF